ncbi:TraB/GumN family protein [Paludibacter sp.]|uniref:TraB/GumN family protein n=1 Tax=Paludibacter sp. TaxID=1898105 RepID=UPI001353FA7F|nr:TraB/GumN family protein [Paludibacter sp.]MTK53725.1 TraB/GumN family protein [Paludibacter sp.]
MNKKQILLLLVTLLITCSTNAQLLWKISGNGLAKPSYLFGTHHLVDKDQIKNIDQIIDLSKQTDAVVGKMEIPDPATAQMKMLQAGMLTGTTMKELLSPEDYQLADNEFQQLMGAGMAQLGMMKPMLLETLYCSMTFMKAYGMTKQPEAIDAILQKAAKENNKKVIGLETLDQQMDIILNSLPLKRQAEILMKEIKEKQKGIDLLIQITDAYKAGDMAKAEALEKADWSMTANEKKPLIENRNNSWLAKLPELMKSQSCFIAVGFFHLVDDKGLVAQLKKAGYTVEAVTL